MQFVGLFMPHIIRQSRWLLPIKYTVFASQALAHGMCEAEKQIIPEGENLRYVWTCLIRGSHERTA